MTVNYGGIMPESKRCNETRAHYAHEWFNPLRILCPGGPEESMRKRMFTAEEVIEIANETSDSLGNLYRIDFIDRIKHEVEQ